MNTRTGQRGWRATFVALLTLATMLFAMVPSALAAPTTIDLTIFGVRVVATCDTETGQGTATVTIDGELFTTQSGSCAEGGG